MAIIERKKAQQSNLKPIELAILVIVISLAVIALAWVLIGHIGPPNASDAMIKQQISLRQQYGLPPKPVITDPKMLEIPPSLRPSYIQNCIPAAFC